ncbi:lycopene cyclase domain-containing protein [Plantibacter sp. Mn2098]|uniref:lycopene cyclase domain-containing protein n=1 Tax=Plantibacter sp. Mn2098 TaxID=3395266 RepID=UPI003BD23FD2
MTYWALNAWFLAVVGVVGVLALVRLVRDGRDGRGAQRAPDGRPERDGRRGRRGRTVGPWLLAVGVTLIVLLVMTAVFDNVMIGVGLVGYDPALISGAKIGIAPLEDFAYAIAAVVLLPSLWVLLARRTPPTPVSPANEGPAS